MTYIYIHNLQLLSSLSLYPPHTTEMEHPIVPAKLPELEISQMCFAHSGYSLAASGCSSLYPSGLITVH